jgi:hypothetical protein
MNEFYHSCVCVGGPFDGKRMAYDKESFALEKLSDWRMPSQGDIDSNIQPEVINYVREIFALQETAIICWKIKGMTQQDVLMNLLNSYFPLANKQLAIAIEALKFYKDNALKDNYIAAKALYQIENEEKNRS